MTVDLAPLDQFAAVRLPGLLGPAQCADIIAMIGDETVLRPPITRPRETGGGGYRMFAQPLPPPIAALRDALAPAIHAAVERWATLLQGDADYSAQHAARTDRRAAAGKEARTALFSFYEAGDWTPLHQDPPEAYPLLATILLSAPGRDFTGGEFVLTEDWPADCAIRPRVDVVPLAQGDAVIFPTRERAHVGASGAQRVQVNQGMSRVLSGQRHMVAMLF